MLLLTSMLTLAFNIQSAKASGTIYIRADGSIEPSTAPISTVDNVTYIFTDDIYDSIVVERDNIAVDGAGYTVQGTGSGTGISLSGRSNVTVQNTNIKNFGTGIWLESSPNNSLVGNNITHNSYDGIKLWRSSNYNSISGNNITNNDFGIWLFGSLNNSVVGSNIIDNHLGIYLYDYSNYNSIVGNVFVNDGVTVYDSYGNVVVDNLVNSKPLGIP